MIYHYYASPWFATCHQPWSLLASTSQVTIIFLLHFPFGHLTQVMYIHTQAREMGQNETQKHQEGMYKKQIYTHRHALKKPESPIVRNMVSLHSHIVMYPQTHTNTHTQQYTVTLLN